MRYSVRLDSNDLYALSEDILKYADNFDKKVELFLNKLADLSIEVASMNGGDYGRFIVYTKKMPNGTTIIVTGNSKLVKREWYASSTSKTVRREVISPLLMAEFGSGYYAISDDNAPGLGGQGTLNMYGHAFDEDGWYWYADSTSDSEATVVSTSQKGRIKFHSMGVHPSRPLHKAVMACIQQVQEVAIEVFR